MTQTTASDSQRAQRRLRRLLHSAAGPRVLAVTLLLTVHAALLAASAVLDSPTVDERNHLAGGLRRLQAGRFDVDRGNPPLPGTVAAIPVVFAKPHTDWSCAAQPYAPGWMLLDLNGQRAEWLITLGRWACIFFSLIAGYFCFRWADALFGFWSGVLALSLWCFCPVTLAYGHLVTGDVAASAFGLAALYALWRWLREPSFGQAMIAGLILGLAEITKYVWVLLFVLWPMLWLAWRFMERIEGMRTRWRRDILHLAVMAALCLYVINLAYLFEGCFQPISSLRIGQRVLAWVDSKGIPTKWLAAVPVPFPESYLRGIDEIDESCREWFMFVAGRWRLGGPWWFYLYGFLLKLPIGTLLISVLAAAKLCVTRGTDWKSEALLLLPMIALLAFVSFSGVPQALRYALPVVPLACVWASKVVCNRSRSRVPRVFAAAALIGSIGSSLFCYPHTLSYFNEIAGGPSRGHEHFLGCNFDWGQDFFFLKKWLADHPEARPLHLAYYCLPSSRAAEIDTIRVPMATDPEGPKPGWYALSANDLRGISSTHPGHGTDYEYFLGVKPVASAGYSVLIYHLTLIEANKLREQLGLPPLSDETSK